MSVARACCAWDAVKVSKPDAPSDDFLVAKSDHSAAQAQFSADLRGSRRRPREFLSHNRLGDLADDTTAALRARRYRTPYHNLSRTLLLALVAMMVSSAVHNVVVHVGVNGCGRSNFLEEECRPTYMAYVAVPYLARLVLATGVPALLFSRRIFSIRKLRRTMVCNSKQDLSAMPLTKIKDMAGHWVSAASLDIFQEVVDMVSDTQWMLVLTIVGTWAIGSLAVLNTALTAGDADLLVSDCRVVDLSTGEQTDDLLCQVGRRGFMFFTHSVMCLNGPLSSSVLFTPRNLWSLVSDHAIQKTGNRWMRRILQLPTIIMATMGLCSAHPLVFLALLVYPGLSNLHLWRFFAVLSPVVVLGQLYLLVHVLRWSRRPRLFTQLAKSLWLLRDLLAKLCGRSPADCPRPIKAVPFIWDCRHSWRYRQLAVYIAALIAFALEVDPWGGALVEYELWAARLLALAMLITWDEEASFKALEASGAGFGLVLNAQQMRRALQDHLEGRPSSGRRVKRYKGTMIRMRETMTVSYRWSSDVVEVEGLGEINFSEWQLRELMHAIERSRCLYVWLDILSVPQEPGRLKTLLLSRMMSVYSASYLTVALMSREAATERYHQRIWTLQEYMSASDLMVRVEGKTADSGEDGKIALVPHEHKDAVQLRGEHLLRQPLCLPVWLMDMHPGLREMATEDVKLIWNTYNEFAATRSCMYDGDQIRAMYPVLFNHPAESQEELISLMRILEECHGIDQRRQNKQLLSSLKTADAKRLPTG